MIVMWLIVFAICIAVLVKSSDLFIDNSKIIGKAFNIPDIVIGITIVGFGTSLPELVTSIIATIKHQPEIAISNVVGSNIANIFLIFGVGAFMLKKSQIKEKIITDIVALIVISAYLYFVSYDGSITMIESATFLVAFAVYMFYLIKTIDKHRDTVEIEEEAKDEVLEEKISLIKPFIFLFASIFGIFISSNYTIQAVVEISKISGIATDVISASAIALGTSLPELVVSAVSAKRGEVNLIFGNVLGSNLFNIFSVIGISGFISTLVVPQSMMTLSLPLMMFGAIIFSINIIWGKVNRPLGIGYIVVYVLFILKLYGVI